MKKVINAAIYLLALMLSFIPCRYAYAYPPDGDGGLLKTWDFDDIESVSEYTDITNASNSSKGITSAIEDGCLKYSKAGTSAHTMYVKLSDYLGEADTYSVGFDLKTVFDKNKNFILRCGTNIQIASQGGGNYIIQCYKDGAFVTGNTEQYALESGVRLVFAIRGEQSVDLYADDGGTLSTIYEGLDYIVSSVTLAKTIGFTFNASSNGDMYIDNISLTTTVPEKKDITVLEFNNCGGSLTLDRGDTFKLRINAEAQSGIEHIDVYNGGDLYTTLTQEPYVVDLTNLDETHTVIKAAAFSNVGDFKEKSIEITLRESSFYTITEDSDFTAADGSTLKSGIAMYSRRGFAKAETVDDLFGTSLLVGIDKANTAYAAADIPYIDIPAGSCDGRLSFECDAYVDVKEDSGKKTIVFRTEDNKEINVVRFKDPQMVVAGKEYVDYEAGRWYHLNVKLDTIASTMDVFIDGFPVVIGYKPSSAMTAIKLIRLYGPGEDTVKCYTALDNIIIKGYYDTPEIKSAQYSYSAEADINEITAYLSSKVWGGSINEDTVHLINDEGTACPLKEIIYDENAAAVIIKPQKALMPDTRYTVVITDGAMLSQDIPFSEEVSGSFTTESSKISVANAALSESSGSVKADVSIKNVTADAMTVYVVMTLWNGNKGVDMKISPITIAAGKTATASLQALRQGADSAQLYIYSDIFASEFLSSRIYEKIFN